MAARTLVALLAAMMAAAGCGGSAGAPTPEEPATTPTAAAEPPAGPPEGRCYRMEFAEALAPATPDRKDRRCRRNHTAETYRVGRLDLVVDGHLVAVDSDHVARQAAKECPAALPAFLGADADALRLSMAQPIWFTPTLDQADRGAEWYRCDVVVVAGDRALVKRKGSLRGALGDDRAGQLAMCGTAAPDEEDFERVVCTADHSWRAVSIIEFESGEYPGRGAARAHGQEPCETTGADHAADPLDYEWGYEWPTKKQWRGGMTYGRCWVPD